jgi:cytochrome subunit of sulfide dehydrogenase
MRVRFAANTLCLSVILAVTASPADAQNAGAIRTLAANCTVCHGTDGVSVGGIPPSIAGQNREYLLQQLKDFRDGKRPATIMQQHAKGYTDAQLEQIAAYFSAVTPRVPMPAPRAGN